MALSGQLIPVVLIPRFCGFVGTSGVEANYPSIALDVSSFVKGTLVFWRGPTLGVESYFVIYEESTDGIVWSEIISVPVSSPSDEPFQFQQDIVFSLRWLRVRIRLPGLSGDSAMSCWCAGSLERRVV